MRVVNNDALAEQIKLFPWRPDATGFARCSGPEKIAILSEHCAMFVSRFQLPLPDPGSDYAITLGPCRSRSPSNRRLQQVQVFPRGEPPLARFRSYRFNDPSTPRTSARPSELPMERTTDLTAASATVWRLELRAPPRDPDGARSPMPKSGH